MADEKDKPAVQPEKKKTINEGRQPPTELRDREKDDFRIVSPDVGHLPEGQNTHE
jgi:hypothetical protein